MRNAAEQEDARRRRNRYIRFPATCTTPRANAQSRCSEAGSSFPIDYKLMTTFDHPRRPWLRVLLLIPYVALLWLPFYNDIRPSLLGFPFFYWYQLLWVPLTSLLLYVAYWSFK
jgi:hypothetical protein